MITPNGIVTGETGVHHRELRRSTEVWGVGAAFFVLGIAALVLGFLIPWLIVVGVVLLVLSLVIMNHAMKLYNRARNNLKKREVV